MERFDHIVVGGGVIGASIAYHLMAKNAGSVLLLDRNELASAASSRAAGLILQVSTKPAKTPLAKRTIDTIPALEMELGESVGFHRVGSLRIATSKSSTVTLEAMAADASSQGISIEWPDLRDVAGVIPWLDIKTVHTAAFFPTDGYADPYLFCMSYINAARARGAEIRPRTAVRDVIRENQNVAGVMTDAGIIASGTVIDACGAWASLLSQQVGYLLPMAPVRSHYWITEPSQDYGGEQPVTVLPDIAAYTRPEAGGLVLGVQEPRSATFDARDLPHDPAAFSATEGEDHWDVLTNAYDNLADVFPSIGNARFSGYINGLSSYTPDGEIILGPVPGVTGFYAAAGDCGAGITLSGGIGDIISDLALGQSPVYDIAAFRPDRFGQVDPFSISFRERCAAARATKSQKTNTTA